MIDEKKTWSQRLGLLIRGSLVTLFFVLVIVSIAALPPILLLDSELLTFADTPLGRFFERATSVGVMVLSVSIFIFLSTTSPPSANAPSGVAMLASPTLTLS